MIVPHNRDLRLLLVGGTLSSVGANGSALALPLLVLDATGSAAQAGLVTGAYVLGLVASGVPSGVIADRWPRRRVMGASAGLSAVVATSVTLWAAGVVQGLTLLTVLVFVSGLLASAFILAETAAIRAVVAQEEVASASVANQARQAAASLLGPLVGGALFAVHPAAPFAFDAATFVVAGSTALFVRANLGRGTKGAGAVGWRRELIDGMGYVMRRRGLRVAALLAMTANFAGDGFLFLVVVYLTEAGARGGLIGAVSSGTGVMLLLGTLAAAPLTNRVRGGVLVQAGFWWLSIGCLLVAQTWGLVPVVILLAIGLAPLPVVGVVVATYTMATTPDRVQGRVQGAFRTVAQGVSPVAPAAAGLIAGWWTVGGALLVFALLVTLGALLVSVTAEMRSLPLLRSLEESQVPA